MNTNENNPTDKIVDQTDVLDTLPCPFCGGMDLKIGRSPAYFFWVYCLSCHIRRHTDTSKDAVLEWNRRAPDPLPNDGLDDSARLDWLEQRAWDGIDECYKLLDDWRTPDGKRHSAGLRSAIDWLRKISP